jgi:pimeloyl-ACP methyl ester carboxylesterase
MMISPTRFPTIKPLGPYSFSVPRMETSTKTAPSLNTHAGPGFFAQQFMNLALALASTPNRLTSAFPHHVSFRERLRLFPDLKTVELKSIDNVSLKGYWLPVKKPSSSTVILLHGFSTNSGSMIPLAQKLHEWGHSVFMLDFRSHGQSGSEKPCTLGYSEGKDILAAVRHVKAEYPEAAKDLTLLGHSMGASAILTMPNSLHAVPGGMDEMSRSVNRLVLDAPYERLDLLKNPFIARLFQTKWINYLFPDLGHAFVDMLNSVDLKNHMNLPSTLDAFRPAQDFLKSKAWSEKPVLLLHGKHDSTTPYEQAERIHQQLKDKNVNIELITLNASHVNPRWEGSDSWFPKRVSLRDDEIYLKALDGHLKKNVENK